MLADTQLAENTQSQDSELDTMIRSVIEEVRPAQKRDGGDRELLGIEGNKVMVRLTGACVLCKLSSATLEGIQARMVEKLGAFVRLIPVAGPPKAKH